MAYEAIIEEQGNGWPQVGDLVDDGEGSVWRVVRAGSRIQIGHYGTLYCYGYQVVEADWEDGDTYPAWVQVGPESTDVDQQNLIDRAMYDT